MALPTEVIEALTQGQPLPKKKLDQAWVNPILDLIQAGIVRPTKALWGWEVKRGGGQMLVHVAAKRGPLPEGFDAWALVNKDGRTVAHVAAEHGHLPEGFDQWALVDQDGRTVAHVAARRGHLPQGFDQWTLADRSGRTVAHVAARFGHLPEGFDQWALADQNGWTVAHDAARRGHLPKNFERWGWADQEGRTVAEYVIRGLYRNYPEKHRLDFWLAPTSTGQRIMDFALERGVITSEEHEAIQQVVLKAQQAHDQARMKTLSGMVF